MRKILFKAKGVHDNKWHYGYLYNIGDDFIKLKENNSKSIVECYKNTLCQLITSFHNFNMEFWENDIIIISLYKDNKIIESIQGHIYWNDYGAVIINVNGKEITDIFEKISNINKEYLIRMEVIGNIFDNPELIQGEKINNYDNTKNSTENNTEKYYKQMIEKYKS